MDAFVLFIKLILFGGCVLVSSCSTTRVSFLKANKASNFDEVRDCSGEESLRRRPSQDRGMCEALLKNKSSVATFFIEKDPLYFSLTGQFQKVHEANGGGNWTGEDRDSDQSYWSSGWLDVKGWGRPLSVKIRARGMSSAQEVEFPKLKVEIEKNVNLEGHPFEGVRKFKMNTHGRNGEAPGPLSRLGRRLDETSPWREAFIYDLGPAWNLAVPGTRRARVTYTDSDTGQITTRNALILETHGSLAKRKNWKEVTDFLEDEKGRMSIEMASRFHFFNIMVGNDDIGLKLKREPTVGTELYRPYFNTMVFEDSEGRYFPLLYDFDLALFVGGWEQRNFDPYRSQAFQIDNGRWGYFFHRLARLRSRMSQAEFDQAANFYKNEAKGKMLKVIKESLADGDAKTLIQEMMGHFESALEKLSKTQMLVKNEVSFFADKEMTSSLMSEDKIYLDSEGNSIPRKLRAGVPLIILEKNALWVKIAVWDIHGDLKDFSQHVGYIKPDDLALGMDLPEELQGLVNHNDLSP